jgi:hypothetical protein
MLLSVGGPAMGMVLSSPAPPIVTAPPPGNSANEVWGKFAICMSQHTGRRVSVGRPPGYGIQVSGPTRPYASEADRKAFMERMRAAGLACGRILAPIQRQYNTSEFEARFRDAMLAMARCMRRKGVNVADAIVTKRPGGGYSVVWPRTQGIQMNSPQWIKARNECQKLVSPLFQTR